MCIRDRPQGVGDVFTGFPDALSQFFLRVVQPFDQALIRLGFFNCVQVLALNVFQQRDFHHLFFSELHDDCRNRLQSRLFTGADAAFAGDQLIAFDGFAQQYRSENTMLLDRLDVYKRQSLLLQKPPVAMMTACALMS